MVKPYKVFGIGLNKTGTTTLGECLKTLGYRHVSYSSALLAAYGEGRIGDVLDGMEGVDSCEDWPWPLVWREAYARFGKRARFVLTTRSSPQVWVESLKRHSLNTHPTRAMRPAIYGHYYPHGYEVEHIAAYEAHNATVRAFFAAEAPHALLEVSWEAGDRWDRLCAFLGEPVPNRDFPHERPRATGVDPAIREANATGIERQLARVEEGRREIAETPLMRAGRAYGRGLPGAR